LMFFRGIASRAARIRRSKAKEVAAIGLAALVVTLLSLVLVGDAFNYPRGVKMAIAPFREANINHIGMEALRNAASGHDYLIVDARLERDFQLASVPNAVNVPVHASVWAIEEYLRDVPKATPIIVFCQSSKCSFDETIARNLVLLGFMNVAVCEAGWSEFRQGLRGNH